MGLGLDHLYFVFGVPLPLNSTLDETFTFNPIPALGPGESASSPFTMTGTLVTPSGILTSVNGIGILTVFCCDAQYNTPSVNFAFTPEPSVFVLLPIGVAALLLLRPRSGRAQDVT